MKYILVVLILGNNAEAVSQVGPFDTAAACELVFDAVLDANRGAAIRPLGCFPLGEPN